jgi:hypothetical protein
LRGLVRLVPLHVHGEHAGDAFLLEAVAGEDRGDAGLLGRRIHPVAVEGVGLSGERAPQSAAMRSTNEIRYMSASRKK